jgi:hypothetical protein
MFFSSERSMVKGMVDVIAEHITAQINVAFAGLIKTGHLKIKDNKVELYKQFDRDGFSVNSLVVLDVTNLAYIQYLEERLKKYECV